MTQAGTGASPESDVAEGSANIASDFTNGGTNHGTSPPARSGGAGLKVGLAAAVLLLVAAIGILLVFRFVAAERDRDLRAWQVRLGIVADSRAAAVEEWLDRRVATLRGLAENTSLQLYMTEVSLAQGKAGAVTDAAAQMGYLRNLLVATAEREGFTAPRGEQIRANVSPVGVAGLALLDAKGAVLVATAGMPPIEGRLADFLARRKRGEPAMLDAFVGADGQPAVGFAMPVFAVQADPGTAREIGTVFGIRPLGSDFYDRLHQPGETLASAETLLVRRGAQTVDYLSPLADGTPPLRRALALDTPDLAAAYAARHPGGFAVAVNYANHRVLVTGRALPHTAWVVVRQVDAAEALAETDYRGRVLLATFLGAILVIAIVIVAVWRHATSVRAAHAAARYQAMAARFRRLSRFLQVVTDGQPTAITVVDEAGKLGFANRQAAARFQISAADMMGKTLASVLGPARAKPYEVLNRQALIERQPTSATHSFVEDGSERVVKSDHIPLLRDGETHGRVLMVMEDVTELFSERARRERTLQQLVSTLLALIDRRDPYAANHSARVAEVAMAIATEMGLSPVEAETARIAASLMNLGKTAVPAALLTKTDKLQEAEIRLIRDSIMTGADILEGVEFDGPVVQTLRQLYENWDGSGEPLGLRGEEILATARVVAVANSFVAQSSSRAWRRGMDFDAVSRNLLAEAGRQFDRRPVAALINILDNRGGRARWADFAGHPPALGG